MSSSIALKRRRTTQRQGSKRRSSKGAFDVCPIGMRRLARKESRQALPIRQAHGVIPKNPTSRIVLIQAHDLGRYHWNENGYEPGRDNHRLSPSAPVEFSSRHHKEFPPVRLFGNVKVVHHATETTIKVSGSFWVTAKSQVSTQWPSLSSPLSLANTTALVI